MGLRVSPAPGPAASADAKDCPPSLASGELSVSNRLSWAEGLLDVLGVEGGGKRTAHTGAGGTGSSPEEDTGVDNKKEEEEEEMLTGRESREGWKAGRGK